MFLTASCFVLLECERNTEILDRTKLKPWPFCCEATVLTGDPKENKDFKKREKKLKIMYRSRMYNYNFYYLFSFFLFLFFLRIDAFWPLQCYIMHNVPNVEQVKGNPILNVMNMRRARCLAHLPGVPGSFVFHKNISYFCKEMRRHKGKTQRRGTVSYCNTTLSKHKLNLQTKKHDIIVKVQTWKLSPGGASGQQIWRLSAAEVGRLQTHEGCSWNWTLYYGSYYYCDFNK